MRERFLFFPNAFFTLVILGFLSGCGVIADSAPAEMARANKVPNLGVKKTGPDVRVSDLERIGNSPEGTGRIKLFFLDNNDGWLARDKQIWKTGDGGTTWSRIYSFNDRPSDIIADLAFVNPQRGWMTTGINLYATTDGGTTWSKVDALTDGFSGTFDTVAVSKKTKTILVGGGETRSNPTGVSRSIEGQRQVIFRSEDGGIKWEKASVPDNTGAITMIRYVTENEAAAIGEFSDDIYTSNNEGKSWGKAAFVAASTGRDLREGNEYKPMGIFAIPAGGTIISYNDGRLIKSDDGGKRWQDQALPAEIWKKNEGGLAYFEEMCFMNESTGWGSKANGHLFKTTDKGAHWTLASSEVGYGDIFFIDGKCKLAFEKGVFEIEK